MGGSRPGPGPWAQELTAFTRAFAGAYLFGMPFLFTMEVWWIGIAAERGKLLGFLGLALVANVGLTHVAGFKEPRGLGTTLDQAVDVLAVGVVAAAATLLVLNRIGPGVPLETALGKVVAQAVPFSIGASVALAIFHPRDGEGRAADDAGGPGGAWRDFFSDVGGTAIGGVFVGWAIAPTEEVPMLAAELGVGHLLAVVGFSLLVGYAIVFASGFDQRPGRGLFQRPSTETALAYLVSLLIAGVTLFFFDQIAPGDPPRFVLAQILVLGLPTTAGGAAGRLVL